MEIREIILLFVSYVLVIDRLEKGLQSLSLFSGRLILDPLDPHWFYPGQLPLTEQEACWLIAYISRIHAMFHPTMVQIEPGEQPERRYQVTLSYPSSDPTQPPMSVVVQSLEDYTTLLRWASGRDSCFERETEALPPEQRASEEQRVFTFRRMIYTYLVNVIT